MRQYDSMNTIWNNNFISILKMLTEKLIYRAWLKSTHRTEDIYGNADDKHYFIYTILSNFTPLCISPIMVADPYPVLSSDSLDFIYLQSMLSTM